MTQRQVSFQFEVLDAGLHVRFLEVSADSSPTLDFNGTQALPRTIRGLTLPSGTYDGVDFGKHRLMPWITIDGDRQPLGLYTFADPVRLPTSAGTTLVVPCIDVLEVIDQQPDDTMYVPAGYPVQAAMELLLATVPQITYEVDGGAGVVGAPMAWPSTDTKLAALNDLAQQHGYYPAYTDNAGVIRLRVIVDPDTDPHPAIDHGALGIVAESISSSDNFLTAHNRYRVIGGDPDRPLVGTYDLPSDAPHSVFNRGYVRTFTVTAPGITTQADADAAAGALSYVDRDQLNTTDYDTPLSTLDHSWAIVRSLAEPRTEEAWSMPLVAGGHMHHRTRRRM